MSKGFNIPSNKHLGNSHDYRKAPQKNSKQIVVQPLQWLPIDRDEDGIATEECLNKMFSSQPFVLSILYDEDLAYCYTIVDKYFLSDFRNDVKKFDEYTHYLPLPKVPKK